MIKKLRNAFALVMFMFEAMSDNADIISQDNQYERIIALRILLERHTDWLKQLVRDEPGLYKYFNESNHIENDYIFQLDPREYYSIPSHYLKVIETFMQSH